MTAPKISVVAVIDLDGTQVRLIVTGRLTVDTQAVLHPLLTRARALTPTTRVVVDLTDADIAQAVEVLRQHTRQEHIGHPSQQLHPLQPAPVGTIHEANTQHATIAAPIAAGPFLGSRPAQHRRAVRAQCPAPIIDWDAPVGEAPRR